jgi:hypothetical protein
MGAVGYRALILNRPWKEGIYIQDLCCIPDGFFDGQAFSESERRSTKKGYADTQAKSPAEKAGLF